MLYINEMSNYIRIDKLSFHSIEVYMLIVLLCLFAFIMLKTNETVTMKIICMYILALPYTDIVYRFHNMQISELLIILLLIYDICHSKISFINNTLTNYMYKFALILTISATISTIAHNENAISIITPYLNIIKYLLIIYMVSKLLIEVKTVKRFELLIKALRWSGNLTAITSIFQCVLYKLGYIVPGIFVMWGIPRTKGLSHEPATNAFVLLSTITVSLISVDKINKCYKIYWFSMILQMVAFILCFSIGAIPILTILALLFIRFTFRRIKITFNKLAIFILVSTFSFFLLCNSTMGFDAFTKLLSKLLGLFTDYSGQTNMSGRGLDILMIKYVMVSNPLIGIGAFNSLNVFNSFPNTNCYFILFAELGILGIIPLGIITLKFIFQVRQNRNLIRVPLYANAYSYFIISFLLIGWLRVIFFHQIWILLAILFIIQNMNQVELRVFICEQDNTFIKKLICMEK